MVINWMIKKTKKAFLYIYNGLKRFRLRIYVFQNSKSCDNVPLYRRLQLNLRGFESDKWLLYNLTKNDINNYMSDYQRWKSRFVNGNYNLILDDKIIAAEVFGKYVQYPRNIAYIQNGEIRSFISNGTVDIDYIYDVLKIKKDLVVKPIVGGEGKGVCFLKFCEGRIYLDNKHITKETLEQYITKLDDYIITEFVYQHKYASNMFSKTTNTIRIITMQDPHSGELSIPVAIHRIGCKKSYPVDNWSNGGISAWIDVETGIIGRATSKDYIYNRNGQFFTTHPDTNAPIKGVKIPNWKVIKEELLKAASKMPKIPFIAWDVVITEKSFSVIEVNASTGVTIFQVHEPLLSNRKIRDFYKYYDVI